MIGASYHRHGAARDGRMVRMGRLLLKVFTVMAVASMVVCSAAIVMWVRSGRGGDAGGVYARRAGVRYTVRSEGGRVTLYEPRTVPPPTRRMPYTAATLSSAASVGCRRQYYSEYHCIHGG
jgi:hypothetical protein